MKRRDFLKLTGGAVAGTVIGSRCLYANSDLPQGSVELHNPILPGYFADPSLIQHDGKFYLYATVDPWGADFLSCWVSEDFQNWTFHRLNWPTKAACRTPQSGGAMVWAPGLIERDGVFYMYVSVGSEIWCGSAPHPLGPWENMLGDKPMVPYDTTRYVHVIDAEAFIDDDGRAYLYWGSGHNWVNGRCIAAEMNDDMKSFKTEPIEITPTNFFEGALMTKHNGKYYLSYSEGRTLDETYEVRYAVGDKPLGPFVEGENSPILTMNRDLQVFGPGHHTFFMFEGKHYILYHRHRLPFVRNSAFRQMCINEFTFNDEKSQINVITPYHTQVFPDLRKEKKELITPRSAVASSAQAAHFAAANVLDNGYVTRWEASENDSTPALTVSFENAVRIGTMEIRFEYASRNYFARIESSNGGDSWEAVADYMATGISGSPVLVSIERECRHIRISFENRSGEARPSIWTLKFS